MILKGNTRGGAADLVNHLLNDSTNDHVEVHGLTGFAADSFADSLFEAEAIAKGTNCQKPFFSLSLNPPALKSVSERDFENAIQQAGDALGLADQPHAIIFHEKEGRRHCHVVWSRIDPENMKAVSDSYTRYKLQEVSRALFLQHGWELPHGLRRDTRGSVNNTSRADQEIAKRSGLTIENHEQLIGKAWAQSDSAKSFAVSLETQGYILAEGKRGFIAVDIYTSDAHSIPRRLKMKKAEIESKLGKPDGLPGVDAARATAEKRRRAIQDLLAADNKKPPKNSQAKEQVNALKQQQRQERQKLIARQKAEKDAQEQSFVRKLFGRIKSAWVASTANLARIRDKWSEQEKNPAPLKQEIVLAREAQEKTFRNERDRLRQQHLSKRRALQGALLRERAANRQKIIFERQRYVRGTDIETRKTAIRDKLIQDRLKSRDRDR